MPSTTPAARKSAYPPQKNKLNFPVIRKANTSAGKTNTVSNAIKKRVKKAAIPQKNTLALPVLPEVSFPAVRRWAMTFARAYVIARQTSEEEVADFIDRLKVAYLLDFPLRRHLDETKEAFESREVADFEETLLPILEYCVDKFCFIMSKDKWAIASHDEVEIPEPGPRPLPRPAWNKKRVAPVSVSVSAPAPAPASAPASPSTPTTSPSLSPSLSPYQLASPAPFLSPFKQHEMSLTPSFGTRSPILPVKSEAPSPISLLHRPSSSKVPCLGSPFSFQSVKQEALPANWRYPSLESSLPSSTAVGSPSLSPSPWSSPSPLRGPVLETYPNVSYGKDISDDESEDDLDDTNFFNYCDRVISRYYAEMDDTSSESDEASDEAEVRRSLSSYDDDEMTGSAQYD